MHFQFKNITRLGITLDYTVLGDYFLVIMEKNPRTIRNHLTIHCQEANFEDFLLI